VTRDSPEISFDFQLSHVIIKSGYMASPEKTVAKSKTKGAPMPEDNQGKGVFKGLAMLASMGIAMVVSTFIGLGIGIYLDGVFGTKPWLTIIFLIFGIAAGFKNMFEMTRRYGL